MNFDYDVIVVGAGHAGCEAACAAANMGSKTLLITMDMNKIAQMSCNPAIGGIAKGQIVREIDALGGQMGIVIDRSAIQFRMLNRSKGPAMWSPRSQADRKQFIENWTNILSHTDNLYMWQDTVTELVFDEKSGSHNTLSEAQSNEASTISNEHCKRLKVVGVKTQLGVKMTAKAVVLTNGTFLDGIMHFGKVQVSGGRISEPASHGIAEQLSGIGFCTARMKTGTPCRIDGKTIDFGACTEQIGDDDFHHFSFMENEQRRLKQRSCWITYTNEKTHEILRSGLKDSPLYNGQIQSIGPRYCPSIETKIVTFADKTSHQLFIEPEGVDSNEYYLNGFSSSMPLDIQIRAIHTIRGLEEAEIYRPGYAIEYNYFDPTQLYHTLETKLVENLFFAGQINGTTGYEEAGGQGLVAGINAHRKIKGEEAFTLSRDEAYIGVLIDDLVTKGVDEPYRMFTSRAEYRILLRQDNADRRLTERGYEIGLVKEDRYSQYMEKKQHIDTILELASNTNIRPADINSFLRSKGSSEISYGTKLRDLVARPELSLKDFISEVESLRILTEHIKNNYDEVLEAAEIEIKYAGYIERERELAEKLHRHDNIPLRGRLDYNSIQSLSTEARQKLTRINPANIGQASRIPGISPNDINILLVLLGR